MRRLNNVSLLRSRGPARRSLLALAGLTLAILPLLSCHPVKRVEGWWSRKPHPPFKKVNPTVAYEIIRDSPGIFIVDLRPPSEYQGVTGHLLHAENFPVAKLPYQLLLLAPYREETFLVYCRGNDTCGADGMRVLIASGFDDAILVDGGIDRWIKEGYKTVLSMAGLPKGTKAGPPEPPTEPTPPGRR